MYVLPIDRDEVEALIGELGYRYQPDGMGRIDHGVWRDAEGRTIEGRALPSLIGELILVGDKKQGRKLRGTRNPVVKRSIDRGNLKHEDFYERARKKGWEVKKGYHRKPGSKWYYPDATTKRGNTVEYKPGSRSGRRSGARQTKNYREITGTRSKALFYPVEDETGPRVEKATPRSGTVEKRKLSVGGKVAQHPYREFYRRRAGGLGKYGGVGGYNVRLKGIRGRILLP